MNDEKKWYICDPDKNTECKKTLCVTDCRITSKRECAVLDGNGEPIEVIPRELLKRKMAGMKLFQ